MTCREEVERYIKEKYGIAPEHPWARWPDYATFSDPDTGKWFALVMRLERRRLGLEGGGETDVVNVKADPGLVAMAAHLPGCLPAYHMNRKHWLTVLLDGTAPKEQVLDRIDGSHAIVTDSPTKRIYEAVRSIPRGKVATYGRIAELAGSPRMARAVGNALHKNTDPEGTPCYRVVNSKGELAAEFVFGGAQVQAEMLRADGIEVTDGKVDLKKYGY